MSTCCHANGICLPEDRCPVCWSDEATRQLALKNAATAKNVWPLLARNAKVEWATDWGAACKALAVGTGLSMSESLLFLAIRELAILRSEVSRLNDHHGYVEGCASCERSRAFAEKQMRVMDLSIKHMEAEHDDW